MKQIEKNKEELFEMMEHLANEELSPDSISDLAMLYGAHKALCLVSGEARAEEHAEPVKAHPKAPQTA